MRSLSTAQAAALEGQSLSVYWLLKCEFPEPVGTIYLSMREFSPAPAVTPMAILTELPTCERAADT